MSRSSHTDLLGYISGALDAPQAEQIEQSLRESPELMQELRACQAAVEPLACLAPAEPPPAGLADRTCERVFAASDAAAHPRNTRWGAREFRMFPRTWRMADWLVLAIVVLILAAVAVPALNHRRFEARLGACQNNIRTVGMAHLAYGDAHGGRLVAVPPEAHLEVAGYQVAVLLDEGWLASPDALRCAGVPESEREVLPTQRQLREAKGPELAALRRRLGGAFAQPFGFVQEGRYRSVDLQRRPTFVLVADAPSIDNPGRRSANHESRGQNCFFEDGHIEFLTTCAVGSDGIFENDLGQIAPGLHENDMVVAPSRTRLLLTEATLERWTQHPAGTTWDK